MKGWRLVIQMWRAAATSGRFCSTARRSFFVRQPKFAQQGPDRTATHGHAMRHHDLGRERRGGQIPLLADAAGDPVLQGRQFAMPAAIPLRLGRKATGGRL